MSDDHASSIERAVADLEMLSSAYPDEVTLSSPLPSPDDTTYLSPSLFPLTFTLTLSSSPVSSKQHAFIITMELPLGYPTQKQLEIKSFRGGGYDKTIIEQIVRAIRQVSDECFENGEEAAFRVCQVAQEAWYESQQKEEEEQQQEERRKKNEEQNLVENEEGEDIQWISGTLFTDKKSTFQAHVTKVRGEMDVKRALRKLIDEGTTKIQRATHNMYAYRFSGVVGTTNSKKIWIHDNDDDGEDGAGSRLAHLLEMRNEDGVLVVVSRWFGGILLGPKRFAHIVNVARELLQQCHDDGLLNE